MKIKTNMFFWRLNNEFANILQKVRLFCPRAFIRGWHFAEKCLKRGPVNAHLISWLCKAQNIQNLENIW